MAGSPMASGEKPRTSSLNWALVPDELLPPVALIKVSSKTTVRKRISPSVKGDA
jgi:hypothetical protein